VERARGTLEHALQLKPDYERAAIALSECPPPGAPSWWGTLGGWLGGGKGGGAGGGTRAEAQRGGSNRNVAFLEEWLGWEAFAGTLTKPLK
jgi:hypothetical protein